MKEMSQKEKLREKITWNVEDDRNVEMIRIRNIRFLNLKSGRMNVGMKVNVLEQFCERKGLNGTKENWRKNVEHETELKETEVNELLAKKKLAKSRKKKWNSLENVRKDCIV